ncbi:MAG: hypothetical protein L3J39_05025 [Verrucomicrobiales bacterium]|nr:hypothetical protein [Verrucomicrobiales bacterium]
MAKEKTANKPAKSFEGIEWNTATKLQGSIEFLDWSGMTETTRQACLEGERGGAHQYKHVVLSQIFLKFDSLTTKADFLADLLSIRIDKIMRASVKGALGTFVGQSELASWRNFSKTALEGKS